MSNLHKSKRYDLIDMFKYTSRYLDDIFTIDNPEFEKHFPDKYPTEIQLYKANTSDKGTSLLDLNTEVIGSDVHTSVYDKRDNFGFPIVNFPWLSGMFRDSHLMVFTCTFLSQLDLLGAALAFRISILKIFKRERTVSPKALKNVHRNYKIYDINTIFTSFDQNTAELYYNHILLTMICIFWLEFGLKPRYFA